MGGHYLKRLVIVFVFFVVLTSQSVVFAVAPSVSLNTNTTTNIVVGQPVTISAYSTGIANPIYQFKVYIGGLWYSLSGYGTRSEVIYYPINIGTLQFFVMCKDSDLINTEIIKYSNYYTVNESEINKATQTIIYIGGVIISTILVLIFSVYWSRNT